MNCKVDFVNNKYPTIELKEGSELSENLTIQNSPILFGCRIGICGTCLIKVHSESPIPLHTRSSDEDEYLEGLFPGDPTLRLACQVKINTNIKIERKKI